MIAGIACAGCVFFAPPPSEQRGRVTRGQCRAHAPSLDYMDGAPRTVWPMVSSTAWCGDHAVVDGAVG